MNNLLLAIKILHIKFACRDDLLNRKYVKIIHVIYKNLSLVSLFP